MSRYVKRCERVLGMPRTYIKYPISGYGLLDANVISIPNALIDQRNEYIRILFRDRVFQ